MDDMDSITIDWKDNEGNDDFDDTQWEGVKANFAHYRLFGEVNGKKGRPPKDDLRRIERSSGENKTVNIRGGKTVCTLVTEDGQKATGVALCSLSDHFCYETGREVSLEKAAEKLILVLLAK